MSKRDIILIAITVVLVGVMIGGFVYDRTPALINRTNTYQFADDKNIKVIAAEKKGITYRRVYYEVKLQILNGDWESYALMFSDMTGNMGALMTAEQYTEYENKALATAVLKPVPAEDSPTWLLALDDEDYSLVYMADKEADGNAYFYIYYNRK
ncbi:hypothetical protein SAMN02910456_02560 [Ruminococcaceae bacterium YRB3002]|nr:hypothetical protein SAMN02910456_02560 [Ruminococcaceae bacterium YRB3002]